MNVVVGGVNCPSNTDNKSFNIFTGRELEE